jgi:hypothetical protein
VGGSEVNHRSFEAIGSSQKNNKPIVEGGIVKSEVEDIKLKVIYFNAQSIVNKRNEFEILVDMYKPDIIAISETWTNDEIVDAELRLDGYYLLRRDRISKRGGGVLLYIANFIKVKELKTEETAVFKNILSAT